MKYADIIMIENEVKMLLKSMDTQNIYYNDFEWFSEVNYTTTTEYLGELKMFLQKALYDNELKRYQKELRKIRKLIDTAFSAH